MTTTSIQSSKFGKAEYPINWNLDPNQFDYDSATEFYHDRIETHFNSICHEQGSTGSVLLYTSEVYVDINDNTEIDFSDVIEDAVLRAYEDLCTASEQGRFNLTSGG